MVVSRVPPRRPSTNKKWAHRPLLHAPPNRQRRQSFTARRRVASPGARHAGQGTSRLSAKSSPGRGSKQPLRTATAGPFPVVTECRGRVRIGRPCDRRPLHEARTDPQTTGCAPRRPAEPARFTRRRTKNAWTGRPPRRMKRSGVAETALPGLFSQQKRALAAAACIHGPGPFHGRRATDGRSDGRSVRVRETAHRASRLSRTADRPAIRPNTAPDTRPVPPG